MTPRGRDDSHHIRRMRLATFPLRPAAARAKRAEPGELRGRRGGRPQAASLPARPCCCASTSRRWSRSRCVPRTPATPSWRFVAVEVERLRREMAEVVDAALDIMAGLPNARGVDADIRIRAYATFSTRRS